MYRYSQAHYIWLQNADTMHLAVLNPARFLQGVSIGRYNIAGLISDVSEEVATQIAKNCRRRQPYSHLRPRQEEPPDHVLYDDMLPLVGL